MAEEVTIGPYSPVSNSSKCEEIDSAAPAVPASSNPAPISRSRVPSTSFRPRIAIIGSGLSGLSCAIALQQVGISCTIFERDKSLFERKQGYGLTLTNNPVGPLAELGVLDECIKQDCESWEHWVLDNDGYILGYFGRQFDIDTINPETPDTSRRSLPNYSPSDALPTPSPSPDPVSFPFPLPSPSPSASPDPSESSSSRPACAPGGRSVCTNLRIPREDLRRLLYNKLDPKYVSIEWGCVLKNYLALDSMDKSKPDSQREGLIQLQFENRDNFDCHVLVGADGINSFVRNLRDVKEYGTLEENPCPLKYLNVCVILGISPYQHEYFNKKGIYMLDGTARLFTMPFRAAEIDKETGNIISPSLTMWQLSFYQPDEPQAKKLKKASNIEQLNKALNRIKMWKMKCIGGLLKETPLGEVWSTPLYDREAIKPRKNRFQHDSKSSVGVVVLGDACHPMSMFKGQGANQALQDGPLLVQWLKHGHSKNVYKGKTEDMSIEKNEDTEWKLTRKQLLNRLKIFEIETVSRTNTRVNASREAARYYHCNEAVEITSFYGLGGGVDLSKKDIIVLLNELKKRKISSVDYDSPDELGAVVRQVIKELFPITEKQHKKLKSRRQRHRELAMQWM